jgi:hypothetical protein
MLLPALTLALPGTATKAADNGFYLGAGVINSTTSATFTT